MYVHSTYIPFYNTINAITLSYEREEFFDRFDAGVNDAIVNS